MCAGAIVNARIPKVVYGIKDPRAGALGSLLDLSVYPLEGRPLYRAGLLENESRCLLSSFFEKLRKKEKN
jgi:tRNA(adenine34) deaminase